MPHIYLASDGLDVDGKDNGEGGSTRLAYHVLEAATEGEARALAAAIAPLAYVAGVETLVRQAINIKPTGFDCWRAEVDYGPEGDEDSQEQPEPGTWKFSFDTTGGRHRVTKSKQTISRHWKSGTDEAPDLEGAIEYDGERVNGAEIYVPNLAFTITAYYDPMAITPAFMKTIGRASARMNTDTWLTFDPGEVLFLGGKAEGDIPTVAGQRVAPIAVQLFFEMSENITNLDPSFTLGDPQAQIDARGWDYVWYRFKKQIDDDQPLLTPVHAYVEEMYDPLAFGAFFGFGGG